MALENSKYVKEPERAQVRLASRDRQKPSTIDHGHQFRNLLIKKRAIIARPIPVTAHKKSPPKIELNKTAVFDKSPEAERIKILVPQDFHSPLAGSLAAVPIERLIEENSSILAHAKIAAHGEEEINRLIRKLTLSFTAKKHESQFSIALGVFNGARFHLLTDDKDLSLKVSYASESAKSLLTHHREQLKNRLAEHEINLRDLTFIS